METVVIKSHRYGITLVLDDKTEFEPLIHEICRKFAQARDFFGETELVLEIKGRAVTDEEAAVIIEAIELNSHIRIILLSQNDTSKEVKIKRQIDKFYYEKEMNHAKIIKEHVGRNQEITSDSGLVILGDVKANASVRARGSILIFGALEGNAVAGDPDNQRCFIVANELNPQSVRIGTCEGDITYQDKWLMRTIRKKTPMVVAVWDNSLLAEPLSGGMLKQI